MNFFGHAVAASWRSSESAFGLGAMLPDFASMIGARIISVSDPRTAAGVDWHHRTDAVFHQLEAFRGLSHKLTGQLASRGIGRGGSLAAGHVGFELILDGLLLESSDVDASGLYLGAIEAASGAAPGIELVDRRPRRSAPDLRFLELVGFLEERGLPDGYKDPATVADRVLRVVADRPRLAIEARHKGTLAAALADMKSELAPLVPDILEELRSRLEAASSDGGGGAESPRGWWRR